MYVKLVVALVLLCLVVQCEKRVEQHKMGKSLIFPDHPLYNHFASRRGAAQSSYDFEMGGNIYPVGIYWTQVGLGTPTQFFQVAVDSGSSDLIVPSSTCQGCHTQYTGVYDQTTSSSSIPISCQNQTVSCKIDCQNQCSFKDSYQTCNLTDPQQVCSVSGVLYSETFHEGPLSASVVFGAIEEQTSNFQQFYVIDGVLGMAFATISSWGGTPPFDRLVDAGEIEPIFAMCMHPTDGGVLTIGGTNSSLYTGEFQYTPMVSVRNKYYFYVLDLTDVQIGGTSIGLAPAVYSENGFGGCVLDSGTNVILFPEQIYIAFQKTFQNSLCPGFSVPGVCENDANLFTGVCYQYNQTQIDQFPTISFSVSGISLTVDGADYIVNNSTGYYCLGFLNTGVGGNLIVGDVLMQNYYVSFDKGNYQLGWATPNMENCVGESGYYYNGN